MFSKALTSLVLLLSAFSIISPVLSVPIEKAELDGSARKFLTRRATPAAPHFVVYSDAWVSGENGPPAPSEINVCLHIMSLSNVFV